MALLAVCILAVAGLVTVSASPAHAADTAPSAVIAGAATTLNRPAAIAFNSAGDMYVTNRNDNSVLSFPASANGNVVPSLSISGPSTGFNTPNGITFDSADNLYVGNAISGGSINVFAPGASEDATPIRTIAGSNTELEGTQGLTVDAADNLYATCTDGCGTAAGPGRVLVFPPGANGNVPPAREITGGNTKLNHPVGIAVDPAGNIYTGNFQGGGGIVVFGPGADGNVAPIREIKGSNTLLTSTGSIYLDNAGNLYGNSYTNNAVAMFPSTGNGDIAPTQSIKGPATLLSGPWGFGLDGFGRIFVANFLNHSITVYGAVVPQPPAIPPVPTAVAGDGSVSVTVAAATGPTPTSFTVTAVEDPSKSCTVTGASGSCVVAGLTNGTSYTFTTTATNGDGTSSSSSASAPVTPTRSGHRTQRPAGACVTSGSSAHSIPTNGRRTLMKPGCDTNAGQRVGVTVSANLRGDLRYYDLSCKVSKHKVKGTSRTGYSSTSRYCKRGAMKIRTYGHHLRIRISWYAPATHGYGVYKKSKTYTT